jgi:hypothetical protein
MRRRRSPRFFPISLNAMIQETLRRTVTLSVIN